MLYLIKIPKKETAVDIFTDKVKAFVEENRLIRRKDRIIIGLSGGADSVCLFRMLVYLAEEYGLMLCAVHVNHGIRKEDAYADEKFAKELAEEYNVPFRSYYYPVEQIAADKNMTVEEAGRYVRYEAFEKERLRFGADKIAVAHHKNDQVETILFRMCRGTGIKGLLGMDVCRGNIIRPLMCLKRQEIIEYLNASGQAYREDATNSSTDYDRNRIRLNVIPQFEHINSGAVEHIDALSQNLRDVYGWFEAETDRMYKEYVTEEKDCVSISCRDICGVPKAAAGELVRKMINALTKSLKDITKYNIDSVLALADTETGKQTDLPYGLCAKKQYDVLMISREKDSARDEGRDRFEYTLSKEAAASSPVNIRVAGVYLPDEGVFHEKLDIVFSVKKYNPGIMDIPKNNCTKWFDYDRIKSKLSIRRPYENDRFRLSGGETKKLTRYMIDKRIPRQYRKNILLAAEDGCILSVLGGYAVKDYYVRDDTKTILEISFR